jgi:hypothetical protein
MLRSLLKSDLKLVSLIVPLIGATLASAAFAQGVSPARVKRAKEIIAIEDGRREFSDGIEQVMQKAQPYCISQACAAAMLDVRIAGRRHGALRGAAVIDAMQSRREIVNSMTRFVHAYKDEHPEYSAEFAQNQWVERIDEVKAKMDSLPVRNEGRDLIPSQSSSPSSGLDPVMPSGAACTDPPCKHPTLSAICVGGCRAGAVIAAGLCRLIGDPVLEVACDIAADVARSLCEGGCDRVYCQ